jgi:hypothetical protein
VRFETFDEKRCGDPNDTHEGDEEEPERFTGKSEHALVFVAIRERGR